MRELMHQQDGKQRQGKWQAGDKCGWLPIEQREIVEEFFKGESFAVSIGNRKLRAGHETRTQSGEE